MPRLWVKDEHGHSKIVYKGVEELEQVKIAQPATVNLPPGEKQVKRHKCKQCGKKFATVGVASIHYKRNHAVTDDKNEWRSQIETVNDPDATESH